MRQRIVRRVGALAAIFMTLFAVSAIVAPAANASAQGCTNSQIGAWPAWVCTSVWGSKLRVDHISVSIDIAHYTCNGNFKAWGTLKNGKHYDSGVKHGKCGVGRVWVDWYPKKSFKNGTKVCGAIVENGKTRPEHACIKIHS